MKVNVRGTNIEGALRTLKRKIKENNLINDLREREFYEKPCQKRNKKKSAAKLREKRRQEKPN
jgi:small subunit ribosomal protein S21